MDGPSLGQSETRAQAAPCLCLRQQTQDRRAEEGSGCERHPLGQMMKRPIAENRFPLFQPDGLDDVKDPSPVRDGRFWHMFGSGGTVTSETRLVHHATASALDGPLRQEPLIALTVAGSGVAAPGVVHAGGVFHNCISRPNSCARAGATHIWCRMRASPGARGTRQCVICHRRPGRRPRSQPWPGAESGRIRQERPFHRAA